MKSRLALTLILVLLLGTAAWIVLGEPAPQPGQELAEEQTTADVLQPGNLSSGKNSNVDPVKPQRIDLDSTLPIGQHSAPTLSQGAAISSFFGHIQDDAGKAIAGVTVHAFGMIGWATAWNGDASALSARWETTSDQNGYFAFPPTPRDRLRFLIEFDHPEFAQHEVSNLPATIGRSRDLGTITLGPGFRLQGTVFAPNGSPLAHAQVTPFRNSPPNSFAGSAKQPRPLAASTTTDGAGKFTFSALPTRAIRLRAQADRFFPEWSPTIAGSHGQLVEGVELHLDIAHEAYGVILDDRRMPVAGARVLVESNTRSGRDAKDNIETTSDSDGRFRLALSETPDRRTITVGAEGYWVTSQNLSANKLNGQLEILLTPIPPLSGVVVDENGRSIAGATVSLVANRQGLVNPRDMLANTQTISAEDGSFSFTPNLRSAWGGRFTVYAWSDSLSVGQSEMFRLRGAKRFQAPDLQIVLGSGFRAFGVVVAPDGTPRANTRIHLRALRKPRKNQFGQEPGTQRGGDIFALATSTTDGSFSFDGIAPGDYRLEAYHSGLSPAESEDFALIDQDYETRLQLVAASGIAGRVEGPIDQFHNLRVSATSPGLDNLDTTVDALGEFRFEEIMPGLWNLQLRAGDQDANNTAFIWGNTEPLARLDGLDVPVGQTVPAMLPIDLAGRVSLSGKVMINGIPATDYSIFVLPQISGQGGSTSSFSGRNLARQMRVATSDFAGNYHLAALTAESYWVILCRPGLSPSNLGFGSGEGTPPGGLQTLEVQLGNGNDRNLNFDVFLGSVKLTISNPDGGLPSRARLIPDPEDGRRSHSFFLRPKGYSLNDISAGHYLLQLRTPNGWISTQITVPNQSQANITVSLPTEQVQSKDSKPPR